VEVRASSVEWKNITTTMPLVDSLSPRRRSGESAGAFQLAEARQFDATLPSPPLVPRRQRTPRTFIAPRAPDPAGRLSARRPGAQRVRMQSATWGGFRHEQAVGAAATGDRSRSKGGLMRREWGTSAMRLSRCIQKTLKSLSNDVASLRARRMLA